MDMASNTELVVYGNGWSKSQNDMRFLCGVLPKIVEFLQNWNEIRKEWGESGLTRGRWLNWAYRCCDNYYRGSRMEFIEWIDFDGDLLYDVGLMVSDYTTPGGWRRADYIPYDCDEVFPSFISTDETMVHCNGIELIPLGDDRNEFGLTALEMEGHSEPLHECAAEKEVPEEELECCIICADELTTGCAEMPCCGARIHTRCFSNCIANTTGTEEGNTRGQCIFCRETICDPIKLDYIVEEKISNLRDSARQSWEEVEEGMVKNQKLVKLLQTEKQRFERLEQEHAKLRIDYECVAYEAKRRKDTIKKLRRGVKGKRKLLKEKVKVQTAFREERRLRQEERNVRCMHIGCKHKPFKLDKNRQSKAYEKHVKGHLMCELMSSVSIESNIKLNSHATKCQSLMRGYNTRKLSLYRLWKMVR